jgi:hypothetical protein
MLWSEQLFAAKVLSDASHHSTTFPKLQASPPQSLPVSIGCKRGKHRLNGDSPVLSAAVNLKDPRAGQDQYIPVRGVRGPNAIAFQPPSNAPRLCPNTEKELGQARRIRENAPLSSKIGR